MVVGSPALFVSQQGKQHRFQPQWLHPGPGQFINDMFPRDLQTTAHLSDVLDLCMNVVLVGCELPRYPELLDLE